LRRYRTKDCTATSNSECAACAPGKASTGGETECNVCGSGEYSSEGAGFCSTARAGEEVVKDGELRVGAASCTAGRYSTGSVDSCTPCGTGISSEGASRCEYCGPGTHANAATNTCDECGIGFYSLGGVSACSECEPGSFNTEKGSTSCQQCPPGTVPVEKLCDDCEVSDQAISSCLYSVNGLANPCRPLARCRWASTPPSGRLPASFAMATGNTRTSLLSPPASSHPPPRFLRLTGWAPRSARETTTHWALSTGKRHSTTKRAVSTNSFRFAQLLSLPEQWAQQPWRSALRELPGREVVRPAQQRLQTLPSG
jgi:hypothetical protein